MYHFQMVQGGQGIRFQDPSDPVFTNAVFSYHEERGLGTFRIFFLSVKSIITYL